METSELKSCPFCGGEAEFIPSAPKSGYDRVACKSCDTEHAKDGKSACIQSWNIRTPDLAAEVLRLREREAKLTQELNHVLARMNAAAVEIEHAERLARAALKAKGTE